MNTNHSSHYQCMSIEPALVQEQRVENPGDIPPKPLHWITEAIEKLMRAGLKDGEHWRKDVEKAANHIHRALTGEWRQ